MRVFSILLGASALALIWHTPLHAQRDFGGSADYYFDDYIEEEPEAEPIRLKYAPQFKPAVYAYPPPYYVTAIEVIPRPAPPPPRYKSQSAFPFEDKLLDRFTAAELETFNGDRELRRYIETLEKVKDDSDAKWASLQRPIVIAAAMTQDAVEDVCADPEACPDEGVGDNIIVTASRASSPSMSAVSAVTAVSGDTITNVQTGGVDEGDIVKQIGNYLLVLQDGRIFSINIKDMKLKDRADVYRRKAPGAAKKAYYYDEFEGADWYDEMLVQGDHILITAYSYSDSASEISVFKLDQATGKIRSQGVFLISSDDYYDSDNYATRIVGDRLVVYTPYELDQFEEREGRPVLRRWVPESERKQRQVKGKPLLDAHNIYKPVLRTAEPYIHSISVCPLGDFEKTRNLDCHSTGFIGPRDAEMFVSRDNVYLWNNTWSEVNEVSRDDCVANWRRWDDVPHPGLPRAVRKDVVPGAVYRLPIRGGEPGVIGVNGAPYDQFSMDERDGKFRALADWRTFRCEGTEYAPAEAAFLSVAENDFVREFLPVAGFSYTEVPSPGKTVVENRFADDWLVYGGRDQYSGRPPEDSDKDALALLAKPTPLIAVPVKRPKTAKILTLPHNVIRAERLGNDMIINGYHDASGLDMTLLGLGTDAKILSSMHLTNRYESEGRSHAFNAMLNRDSSGLIGIPTVERKQDSNRWSWWSASSDISFVAKASSGTLSDAGALIATPKDDVATHADYKCEVSCIDWYGNSRPIFTGGRIFGLMGTALVEAELLQGKMREKQRIDLTAPLLP